MTRQMKSSGVEWIGDIPEKWNVRKLFQVFTQVKNKNQGMVETNLLSLSYGKIKQKNIETSFGLLPESFETYNIIDKNDIVLRLTDLQNDQKSLRVGLSTQRGIITSAYVTMRAKNPHMAPYLYYLLHTFDIEKGFYGMGDGVRQGLNWDELKHLSFVLPSLSEQQKIADYLDEKCGAIDEIIVKTEQSIEEYKKLKQSVITEAVTKGVRPNRKMKDSGVEWIGEIPADWEVKRFKYIANRFLKGNGITKDEIHENGNTKCVRYGEIYSKYDNQFSDCLSRTNSEKISQTQYFSYGDILFAGTGELVEEIGKNIVYLGYEKCLAGGDIIVVKHLQNPKFLNYALNSNYCIIQKRLNKIKLKVVHISANEIKNILVVLPSLNEQKEIADYLDKKCAKIDVLIEKKQQFLTELATYKKSLIYEYVTGKKEVV